LHLHMIEKTKKQPQMNTEAQQMHGLQAHQDTDQN